MTQYIVKRLLFSLLVLFVISVVVFVAVRMIPGDVCSIVLATSDVEESQCRAIREELGLDEPVVTQYFRYMGNVLRGDFGTTLISKRDVWGEIRTRIPLTLELTFLATTFAIALAIPIGVISAIRQDRPIDYALRFLTIGWLSIPSFWLGTMLIVFPANWWGYSPPPEYTDIWNDPLKNLEQLYLPAFSLGLALSASLARITRSSMLEVLRQDYIRTAWAKGLRERAIIFQHALKNAMLPVITVLGLTMAALVGGTVIFETLFGLPGLGTYLVRAVQQKDFVVIQGVTLFFATSVVVINLVVDVSYTILDPRART